MNKLFTTLFFILIVLSWQSEYLYSQQVTISLTPAPPGQLKTAQFWSMTIINNDSNTYEGYLEGSITHSKDGKVVTAKSNGFAIKPGTKTYNANNIPGGTFKILNEKYKGIETGSPPSGNYSLCIELKNTQKSLAKDCQEITIEETITLPGIALQLILPQDEQKVDANIPLIFTWSPLTGEGVSYNLKVVEYKDTKPGINSFINSRVFFEKEDLKMTAFTYPVSGKKLEEGSKYLWSVQGFINGKPSGENKGWVMPYSFEISKGEEIKTDTNNYITQDTTENIFSDTTTIEKELLLVDLISPIDEQKTDAKQLNFKWTLREPLDTSVKYTYHIKVYELKDIKNQKTDLSNIPLFYEQKGIKQTNLISRKEFDKKNLYVWKILVEDQKGITIGSSQTQVFYWTWTWPWTWCWAWPFNQTINTCAATVNISRPWAMFMNCNNRTWEYTLDGVGPTAMPSSLTLTSITPGTHTFKINLKCNCSSNTYTWNYTINVFPNISADIKLHSATGVSVNTGKMCVIDDATLVATGIPANDPNVRWSIYNWNTFTWQPFGIGVTYNTNPMNSAPMSSFFDFATFCSNNCSSTTNNFKKIYFRAEYYINGTTIQCAQKYVWVDVYCQPKAAPITISAYNNCITQGTTTPVTFSVNLSQICGQITWPNGSHGATYTASFGVGANQTISATIRTVDASGNPGPCNAITVSASISIDPILSCTAVTNKTSVCLNEDATVSVNVTPTTVPVTYQWFYSVDDNDNNCMNSNPNPWVFDGTGSSHNTNEIGPQGPYSPAPTKNVIWRVIVTNPNHTCPVTDPNCPCRVCTTCVRIDIIQKPCKPIINITGPLPPRCLGDPVTLVASLSSSPTGCSNTGLTYKWFLDGVFVGTGPTYTATGPGNYQVQDYNQCDSNMSDIKHIDYCIMDVVVEAPCCVAPGTSVTLNVKDSQGGSVFSSCGGSYQISWQNCSGLPVLSNTTSLTVAPLTTTCYQVTVKDSKGCPKIVQVTVKVCN